MLGISIILFNESFRKALLGSIIILIISPFIWKNVQKKYDSEYFSKVTQNFADFPVNLTFENLTYFSFDTQNNPLMVSAPVAQSDDIKTQNLSLKNPLVKFLDNNGDLISVHSENADYNNKHHKITLQNNVKIHSEKNNLVSKKNIITLDTNSNILNIPHSLNITTPQGTLQSGKLSAIKKDKKIIFSEGVHIKINPQSFNP